MDVESGAASAQAERGSREGEGKEEEAVQPKVPQGVYLEDESAEKGETVALPLHKLGLLDIFLQTDAQPFQTEYHHLLEGRLSREEFQDLLATLNSVPFLTPPPASDFEPPPHPPTSCSSLRLPPPRACGPRWADR